ncbi:MAG: phosphoglucomutase/phosphomannomutase family protein [Saprospiraceae bacterium]|nr:phosphoglucomutase/phosphomannomutase family protein [Saprospiraceae bacterium]
MKKIKFGTDGWRAIIAEDYTLENLRRIAYGTALWMKSKSMTKVIIGHDCRFGGRMFMEEASCVLAEQGITVLYSDGIVSTPMISLGVVKHKADLGIVITASHNPPSYNGFKLKSSYGGPTIPSEIEEVENLIPDHPVEIQKSFSEYFNSGLIHLVLLENDYLAHVKTHFNIQRINEKVNIAYDAMFGAGQNAMKKLFTNIKLFHCEQNPGFNNTPPEPISKNLNEISQFLSSNPGKYTGVAHDGDADRVAMLDDNGNIVDSHHILLLLLHYLAGYKKMTGKVVVSFSVTNKLKILADHYGLQTDITKIGFKYIAEKMIKEDVLVAGEESGGLAIKGHIPERDGVWIALTIFEFMAETGKSLMELVQEVYQIVGSFVYDRLDLKLSEVQIQTVKNILSTKKFDQFGNFKVLNYENIDGDKYYFDKGSWIMYRASGTEPVLRIYAQAQNQDELQELFKYAKEAVGL